MKQSSWTDLDTPLISYALDKGTSRDSLTENVIISPSRSMALLAKIWRWRSSYERRPLPAAHWRASLVSRLECFYGRRTQNCYPKVLETVHSGRARLFG